MATWDTDVTVAAGRLWKAQNSDLAKARIKRALTIFDAHAQLQICRPDYLTPEAWERAKDDSNRFMREHVTDAILQAVQPEALYGAPVGGSLTLILFLQGDEIVEFSGGRVLTAAGREFFLSGHWNGNSHHPP